MNYDENHNNTVIADDNLECKYGQHTEVNYWFQSVVLETQNMQMSRHSPTRVPWITYLLFYCSLLDVMTNRVMVIDLDDR